MQATTSGLRSAGGLDLARLEEAWDYAASLSEHSSLLVVRHGWLCFERYQGAVQAGANRDLHSCGKAFTCTAAGVLMGERPELFPEGLDQPVYHERYLPPQHAPLHDDRKRAIRLGQLLSHTAGLRGNNGSTFDPGGEVVLDPAGPDGSFPDDVAFGHRSWRMRGVETTAETLWCDPGGGYSYASAGPLIVGAMVRHLSGMDLAAYLAQRVFGSIGWEGWRWAVNPPEPDGSSHTKAQGGIAPRPRDAARFGYLHLQGGRWRDKQVIPATHAAIMRRPSAYNPYYPHYGLQVRLNAGGLAPNVPADAYGASGFANNHIDVIPSLDMVVVRIGDRERAADSPDATWARLLSAVCRAVVD